MERPIQRMTEQRRVILDELRKLKSHPTAEELHRQVRKRMARISLGTVYRNLDVLAANGLVRKLDLNGPRTRFDGDMSRHLHVRCTKCGRLDDAPGVEAVLPEEAAAKATGYSILGFRLEFDGLCPSCQTK